MALVILFLLPGCEKKTNWNLQGTSAGRLVVDATITNEFKPFMVKLTLSVAQLNQTPLPATGALVTINEGDKTDTLHEKVKGSGVYYTNNSLVGFVNTNYSLDIFYNNNFYTGQDSMVGITPLDTLQYSVDKSTGLYYISKVAPAFLNGESDMYKVMINRTGVNGFGYLYPSTGKAELDYYTLNTIDVNELFAPPGQMIYFPRGTKIVEKKYSLSPKYAEYIRSMLSMTQWNGGNFDVIPSNVISNINNGALGFFAACSVITSDTIIVK